jgi:hypothetical protein
VVVGPEEKRCAGAGSCASPVASSRCAHSHHPLSRATPVPRPDAPHSHMSDTITLDVKYAQDLVDFWSQKVAGLKADLAAAEVPAHNPRLPPPSADFAA